MRWKMKRDRFRLTSETRGSSNLQAQNAHSRVRGHSLSVSLLNATDELGCGRKSGNQESPDWDPTRILIHIPFVLPESIVNGSLHQKATHSPALRSLPQAAGSLLVLHQAARLTRLARSNLYCQTHCGFLDMLVVAVFVR